MTHINPAGSPEADMPAVMARARERLEASLGPAGILLAMRRRAERLAAERPPSSFPGFGALLAELLPRRRAERSELAAAVGLPLQTVEELAAGEHTALEVAPAAVAELGYAAGLDWQALLAVVDRDVAARIAADRELGVAGYTEEELADLRDRLREAWEDQEVPSTGDDSLPVA